jgi:protein SCO1/2
VSANASAVKRYALAGKIVSVDKDKKTVKIDHEEIPGYMEAMTMVYPVETYSWDRLNPGADIRADLVVNSSAEPPAWLENIAVLASTEQEQPPAAEAEDLPTKETKHRSDALPNFKLTNQDGKKFSLSEYKGKALAITFIYSNCPLPEYCIRMSRNFSDAAILLRNDADYKDKIRLLSISFDPARDTPEKLRSYGQGYLGNDPKPDFTAWQLAVAPDAETRKIADFFGLRYFINPANETQFNHTLVTVIVSPQGRILAVNDDNNWTGADLLGQLKATLK